MITIDHENTDLCRASATLDKDQFYCGYYGGFDNSELTGSNAIYTTTVDIQNLELQNKLKYIDLYISTHQGSIKH